MTNTPMSEREKELVEAVKAMVKGAANNDDGAWERYDRVQDAIRAYSLKPENVRYPEWDELSDYHQRELNGLFADVLGAYKVSAKSIYTRFRSVVTSKAPTE